LTVISAFREDGGVVLENVLTKAEVVQVNSDIDEAMDKTRLGSIKDDEFQQSFHGSKTKRLCTAVTLSKTYRERFVDHPSTRAYVKAAFEGVCDSFWLQSSQVIEISPGEKAQPLHRDMYNYPAIARLGADAPEITVNFLLALVDATEESGATRVYPGSHKGPFLGAFDGNMEKDFPPEKTIPACLAAGSAFFYSGKLVHGGGANTTESYKRRVVGTGFNPGFLVPEDAYPFLIPLTEARTYSLSLQQMLGFRSFHQLDPAGGSLWQKDYEELADFLGL
jgi:ectoine hydroxylase-related dioxygenase (phytanoyl-CoA dioxygenase family)